EQGVRRHQPGLRLAAHFPTPPPPIHDPHDLKQRRSIGLPPVRKKERELLRASDDLREQRGCCALGTRAKVDPEEKPAPHRQGRMYPFHLFGTEFGMRLIQLHALHLHVLHPLAMVRLGPLCSHVLKAMDSLEIHGTDVRRALITDAPALAFQKLFHGRFGEFAPGHQGALPFGELPITSCTAQPVDVFVCACPRSMHDVAFAGVVESCTLWIRTRESGISLLHWRRLYHGGPPVARNGPKDTDVTPVFPRYYSPGLPYFDGARILYILCPSGDTHPKIRIISPTTVTERAVSSFSSSGSHGMRASKHS